MCIRDSVNEVRGAISAQNTTNPGGKIGADPVPDGQEQTITDVYKRQVSTSSVVKGESVQDTIATLQAMKVDSVIVRHYNSGLPNVIARPTCASVVLSLIHL